MNIVVAKILSGLLLWILSLCFGMLVPYLFWKWKSRADHQEPLLQDCTSETASLLSNEEVNCSYQSMGNSQSRERIRLNHCVRCQRWIFKYDITSFVNCCCGGLFLGISFLELFPESNDAVQKVLQGLNITTKLSVSEFIIVIGFLFVMIIEQLVTSVCMNKKYPSFNSSQSNSEERVNLIQNGSGEQTSHAVDDCPNENENDIVFKQSGNAGATRSIVLVTMLSIHSIFEGLALGLEVSISNLIQLLIAISVHKSVIAFSLGLKLFESFRSSRILIAVFCIFIFCTASPLGCGIGTILSAVSGDKPNTGPGTNATTLAPGSTPAYENVSGTLIASAILECLATGTFLFLTFIEVIPSEFFHANHDHSFNELNSDTNSCNDDRKIPIKPVVKLSAVIFGFLAISGLQFV